MPDAKPKRIYLDGAATERMLPCAYDAMVEVLSRATRAEIGNAAALHCAGHHAAILIAEAREHVARLINASPDEIIFTSGGTESNNTVMEIFRGRHVAVSAIEHPSVLASARARAGKVDVVPVDKYGFAKIDNIPQGADLVSIMLANNELGSLTFLTSGATKRALEPSAKNDAPMKMGGGEGCAKAKNVSEPKSLFHSDATQAIGKIPVDVRALGVDYLSFSAHKIGGPLGVGVLYAKNGAPFTNLMYGGKQESGRRAGTSNVPGIVGLGAAAKWCYETKSWEKWAEVANLRNELRARILKEIPGSSANSPAENCLPNILNMSFSAAEGESIQLYLDAEGIIVGTGSACAAGDLQPSHVIMATKNDAEIAHSSVRFSLGLDTTAEDIDRVMDILPCVVRKLQDMSTLKVGGKNER